MKKILFTLVLFFMTIASHGQNYKLCDCNHDGEVTIADVMMVVDVVINGYAPFSVSPTEVTMSVGGTATLDIIGGYSLYEVVSANSEVVEASLNGSTVTLSAVAAGETTVTVRDIQTFRTIEVPVSATPTSYLTCPDDHHPHLIDLGLPSGTKWACCNVDTDHPEDQSPENYGGYYAWGETETNSAYTWSTYTHCGGSKDTCHDLGSDIAGTEYDVAHVKWGGSWVMPTNEQLDELGNNCTSTWTTQNGVSGRLFSGKNGGSIFLPAAGSRNGSDLYGAGSNGYYWSSTQYPSVTCYAYYLNFYSDGTFSDYGLRNGGFSVRPVSSN